jgi:hypothetical protein
MVNWVPLRVPELLVVGLDGLVDSVTGLLPSGLVSVTVIGELAANPYPVTVRYCGLRVGPALAVV